MSERNQKELQQIHNDLVELKKTLNWLNSFGDLWPNPMNGKTWEQEKNEYWDRGINAFEDLLQTGKVKSCEIKRACKMIIKSSEARKEKRGFWNHLSAHPFHSSEYPIYNGFSLDEFLSVLEKVLENPMKREGRSFINQALDRLGAETCKTRACIEAPSSESILAGKSASKNNLKETIFRG